MFEKFRRGAIYALITSVGLVSSVGCETPSTTGGTNNPGSSDGEAQLSVNGDASSDLVAQAKVGDGSSFSIFGNKSAEGNVEQVSQVDFLLSDGETLSLELDDQERPIRVEGGESSTTFSYDDNTATVQAEVVDSAGTAVLEGDVPAQTAAKIIGVEANLETTAQSLCGRLDQVRGILADIFPCETDEGSDPPVDTDVDCRGRGPAVLRVLSQFCENQSELVERVDANLSEARNRIPLGVKGFFTTRPREGGATVVLVATVFGGVRPFESVTWELKSGPETPVENLPRGVAVGDMGEGGPHTFRVTATDADGSTASTDVTVGDGGRLDIEVVADPSVAATGADIFFSIESNVDIPADVLASAKWQFGDGTESVGAEVSHAFDEGGEYVVVVLLRGEGRRETGSTVVRIGDDMECGEVCQTRAEKVFFECDFDGRADVNCAARSNAVLAECVVVHCGEELDCEEHCFRQGDRVRLRCLAAGGASRVCAVVGREARTFCTYEQCDEDADCENFCDEDFDLFRGDCLDESENVAECELNAEDDVDECVVEECGGELDCEGDCADQADRLFAACRDGGASSDECAARSRRFFENCVVDQCEGELDCASACESQAEPIVMECKAEGVPEPMCRERAHEFVADCMFVHCGIFVDDAPIDEPVDPDAVNEFGETFDECSDLCFQDGDAVFLNCRNNGGSTGECNRLADATFDDCLVQFCGVENAPAGDPTDGDDPLGDDPPGDDPPGDDPFDDDPLGGDPSDSGSGGSTGQGGPGNGP